MFARAAATQEEINNLLQAEGDDQADADGDEVEVHVVGSEHGGVRSWYRRFAKVRVMGWRGRGAVAGWMDVEHERLQR